MISFESTIASDGSMRVPDSVRDRVAVGRTIRVMIEEVVDDEGHEHGDRSVSTSADTRKDGDLAATSIAPRLDFCFSKTHRPDGTPIRRLTQEEWSAEAKRLAGSCPGLERPPQPALEERDFGW